jgi:predicted dehydrogenase
MSETIGIGLIGCGGIAHLHTAALRDIAADGVPIRPVAAADPSAENRRAVARNFGFERFYDTAEELLADPDVDAVYVCTPTATHRHLYRATLAAGKHLYAEKPIAPDLPTVRDISAAAAAADVVTQVGFQMRFNSLLARARDIVHSGELGPPMAYTWRDDEAFRGPTPEVARSSSTPSTASTSSTGRSARHGASARSRAGRSASTSRTPRP